MKKQELTELREYITTLSESITIEQIHFYCQVKEQLSFFSFKQRKRVAIMINELNFHLFLLRRTSQERLAKQLKQLYNL